MWKRAGDSAVVKTGMRRCLQSISKVMTLHCFSANSFFINLLYFFHYPLSPLYPHPPPPPWCKLLCLNPYDLNPTDKSTPESSPSEIKLFGEVFVPPHLGRDGDDLNWSLRCYPVKLSLVLWKLKEQGER